jgi:hypothetical protein
MVKEDQWRVGFIEPSESDLEFAKTLLLPGRIIIRGFFIPNLYFKTERDEMAKPKEMKEAPRLLVHEDFIVKNTAAIERLEYDVHSLFGKISTLETKGPPSITIDVKTPGRLAMYAMFMIGMAAGVIVGAYFAPIFYGS